MDERKSIGAGGETLKQVKIVVLANLSILDVPSIKTQKQKGVTTKTWVSGQKSKGAEATLTTTWKSYLKAQWRGAIIFRREESALRR